jgi:hypothetical protein
MQTNKNDCRRGIYPGRFGNIQPSKDIMGALFVAEILWTWVVKYPIFALLVTLAWPPSICWALIESESKGNLLASASDRAIRFAERVTDVLLLT